MSDFSFSFSLLWRWPKDTVKILQARNSKTLLTNGNLHSPIKHGHFQKEKKRSPIEWMDAEDQRRQKESEFRVTSYIKTHHFYCVFLCQKILISDKLLQRNTKESFIVPNIQTRDYWQLLDSWKDGKREETATLFCIQNDVCIIWRKQKLKHESTSLKWWKLCDPVKLCVLVKTPWYG